MLQLGYSDDDMFIWAARTQQSAGCAIIQQTGRVYHDIHHCQMHVLSSAGEHSFVGVDARVLSYLRHVYRKPTSTQQQ